MNELQLKIGGIYDQRTLTFLLEKGINFFELDFRPRSFNFIQKHVVSDLLTRLQAMGNIHLHFANEADFMVNDILELVKANTKNYALVFSDFQTKAYYESFNTPFYWHFRSDVSYKDILSSKLCAGVVFDLEFLEDLLHKGSFEKFITNFYTTTQGFDKEISIKLNWSKYPPAQIMESLSIQRLEMDINNLVEICYRNVDYNKMTSCLKFLQSISC